MIMRRRGILGVALGLIAAPAIVRASNLMALPPHEKVWTISIEEWLAREVEARFVRDEEKRWLRRELRAGFHANPQLVSWAISEEAA